MKSKKVFSISGFHTISANVRVLGEEALTESLIELQMFKNSTNVK
jgi:hypothetical protein